MEYLTYADIKQKVQERTDTEDETFVSASELLRYCHDAIDFCESKIHKFNVGDRYFETVGALQISSGIRDYVLPTDIYANKINKILHKKNSAYYEINRLLRRDRYVAFHDLEQYSVGDSYSYILLNPSVNQKPVLRLTPRPTFTVSTVSATIDTTSGAKTVVVSSATDLVAGQFLSASGIPINTQIEKISGTTLTLSAPATATATSVSTTFINPDVLVYYLRNANKPTGDTDQIDIPEFSSYIIQYMTVEILKKDTGNPRLADEMARLSELEENMTSTLSEMTPDQDNTIEVDDSIYEESV